MAVIRWPHSPRKKKKSRPRLMFLAFFLVAFHFFWFLSSFFLLSIFRGSSSERGPTLSAVQQVQQQQQQQPLLGGSASGKWRLGGDQPLLGDEKGRNLQSTTSTRTSILHSRRAAFFGNTSLLLTLNTTESCQGKEELLSIFYAAAIRPTKKMQRIRVGSGKVGKVPRPSYTTKLRLAGGKQIPSIGAATKDIYRRAAELSAAMKTKVNSQKMQTKPVRKVSRGPKDQNLAGLFEAKRKTMLNMTRPKKMELMPRPRPVKKAEWWRTFRGTSSDMINACPKLPTWQQVTNLYGAEAVVLGMETCAAYRKLIAAAKVQPKVRIAGLFNSGTTSLSQAMFFNFPGTDTNKGMHSQGNSVEYDVPWGKHVPPKYKWQNKHPIRNKESPKYVFPVVIVREPYRWMHSMCKEGYDAVWDREANHCPNIVRTTRDAVGASSVNNKAIPIRVSYQQSQRQINETHASLSDYWSDWIRNYYDLNEPRLLVRHEDLLFRAEDVMLKITECVGLESKLSSPFLYQTSPSKRHGNSGDFLSTLTKYGNEIVVNMTRDDLEYVQSWTPSSRQGLDAELMAKLHYHHPGNVQPPNVYKTFE